MKLLPILPLLAAVLPCFAQQSPNRFQASARLLFNIEAEFGEIGGFSSAASPGPATGGGINRDYDDGYVRLDADGNAGGVTWNWGYRDAAQVPGDNTLRLSSSSGLADGRATADNDLSAGYEIAWLRDLRRSDKWAAGFKLGFAFTDLNFRNSASVWSSSSRLTDVYSLGGIVPPGDPSQPGYQYAGTADTPGPVIDDQPIRRENQLISQGALTTGIRRLDATLWSFKAGPWLELPIHSRISAQLGGGFVLGVLDASYRFAEQTLVTSGGATLQSGAGSAADALAGGYVEALLSTRLSEGFDFIIGGEFMGLESFRERIAGRPVSLDFGASWLLHAGFSLSF